MDIGLILGPFGMKGEVRVLSLSGEPERFLDLEMLTVVRPDGVEETHRIEKARLHKGHALVKLLGVDGRAEAEALKQCYVRLAGGEATNAEKARLERNRLLGVEVFLTDGTRLGVIEEVIETGANDVYEVRDGDKIVLLPAISEVVQSLDLESRRMIVKPLPGLL